MTERDEEGLAALRAIKTSVADAYVGRNGVTAVGLGRKIAGGQFTGRLAIRFYVARKGGAAKESALPTDIQGWPTDVIEADFGHSLRAGRAPNIALTDTGRYLTLLGGISIGARRAPNFPGTLGIVVRENGTNAAMILSNSHVMARLDNGARVGDEICQEAAGDNALGWCGNCATLARWRLGNVPLAGAPGGEVGMDAAVARVSTIFRRTSPLTIAQIGAVAAQPGAAVVGAAIRKRGRSTGLTQGIVFDTDVDVPGAAGAMLRNQISIQPGQIAFSAGGDSGSVYVQGNQVVGLHWATAANGLAIGSPIGPVLTSMGVHL